MSLQKAIEFIQERREEKTKAATEIRVILKILEKETKSRLDDQIFINNDITSIQGKLANPLKIADVKDQFLASKDPNTGRMNKQDTLALISDIAEQRDDLRKNLETVRAQEEKNVKDQIDAYKVLIKDYIERLNTVSRLTFEQKLFIDTFKEVLSNAEGRQATLQDIEAAVVFIKDVIEGSGENVNES